MVSFYTYQTSSSKATYDYYGTNFEQMRIKGLALLRGSTVSIQSGTFTHWAITAYVYDQSYHKLSRVYCYIFSENK